ncbi:MAG TPA: sigma factor-like helix-turn-helix DNA-binding protein [Solirubrobacteraceae bacterium]|nr:sigma factor-like helix-turn-helix DNA-binding protein [Solirubrobacteraceae bacterium]
MRVTELDLSAAALVCLRAADIADVDQLVQHSADELVRKGFGALELYEVVCQLNTQGTSLPASPGGHIYMPNDRNREIFRLRIVEGLTLKEVGERFDLNSERVRQILARHFGLRGSPPTVKARKWAETEQRRAERQAPPATKRKVR